MKFTYRMTALLFSMTLLCSTPVMQALDEASLLQELQKLQAPNPEILSEKFIKDACDFINNIICAHTDLASLIQEDAIKTKDKDAKKTLIKEFIDTQKAMSQIRLQFINNPTRPQLQKTLQHLDAIIQHLKDALKTDITKYTSFSIDEKLPHFENVDPALVKRSRPIEEIAELDEEELTEQFEQTKEEFEAVAKQASNTGLHYGNHLYRNVVDPCVAFFDKHNVHWKILYTTAAIAGGSYLWYKLSTSTNGLPGHLKGNDEPQVDSPGILGKIHDTINYHVRNILGWKPQPGLNDRELTSNQYILNRIRDLGPDHPGSIELQRAMTQKGALPTTLFGEIENEAFSALTGHWYLGATLLWQPFREAITEKYKEIKNTTTNFLLKWHNRCKGGVYYQRYKEQKKLGRIEPRFTFDDIIGLDHPKEVLRDIVKYIQDPESYDRAGLTPAMGYLLFGPTRTGKSMIAEGLAGELQKIKGNSDDFPFFVIEARYIAAAGNFNAIINIIKNYAPCIIFIDEIDMLPLHRDKNKGENTLLQEFLSTISGCMTTSNPDKQVIIIAATNRPENLDKSLRSRLSVHIPFEYPAFIHRAEHLIREIEGKGLPIDQFDIRKLAEQTEGASFQKLHEIVNNAQFITREQGRPITQVDIEKSLNTEMRNIIYHDYAHLSDADQQTLAVHMAGHALGYMLIESKAAQLSQVTIRPVKTKIEDDSIWADYFKDHELPNIQYGHIFTHHAGDSLKFTSKKELKRLCMIELAGRVAENIMLDSQHTTKDTCSCHDATKAFYWARQYHLNGLDETLLKNSKALQDRVSEQAYEFMQACEEEVHELLKDKKDLIEFIAEGLKKFEILGTEEVQALIDLHKMMDGRSVDEFLKEIQEQGAPEESAQDEAEENSEESTTPAE